MPKIYAILFLWNTFIGVSQSINPQVINTAGGNWQLGNTGITISDNIGEPFIETTNNSNLQITQGFLQPYLEPIIVATKSNVSCKDKGDGNISIAISNILQSYTVNYIWSPAYICATTNCSNVNNLQEGTYNLQIIILKPTQSGGTIKDSILKRTFTISNVNEPCKVKLFNAITPNGDGTNDGFIIENIEEFSNNRVTIYNRWGLQIADIYKYNNLTNYWPKKDDVDNLTSSTYFYIINLGDNSRLIKGWIEVLKN